MNQQLGRGRREKTYSHNSKKKRSGSSQQSFNNTNSQCIICKRSNHESRDCRFKCTRCQVPNHSQRDCWFQNKKEQNEAKFTKESDNEHLFYSCLFTGSESQNLWYLDSGCSSHMTGNKDFFVELDHSFTSQVKLGDGKLQKALEKGVIAVHTKGGNKRLISDVLYVPNLSKNPENLLSVGQLLKKGYSVIFDDCKCEIVDKKNNLTVAKVGMSKNKVFPLVIPIEENLALRSESLDISYLWHLRYGHLNYKGVKLLKEKNMVVGLPAIENNGRVCEGCVYGKMHRLPFPKVSWRAKAPLELVHSDICGPMRTPSLNNKRYSFSLLMNIQE